jgi:hypothetical protein
LNCDINILKESNNKNKLTIFVGAGVSKSSGLPSWEDLIKMIKSELSINDDETDYLKIAQLYYLSCGEIVYCQKIKELFPENIEPTCLVPKSYGIILKEIKETDLWAIYCTLMPRQRLELEKKYKNLKRASLS